MESQQQDQSVFFQLPGEIRNSIYKFCVPNLETDSIIDFNMKHYDEKDTHKVPCLQLTCKMLCQEADPFLHEELTLFFDKVRSAQKFCTARSASPIRPSEVRHLQIQVLDARLNSLDLTNILRNISRLFKELRTLHIHDAKQVPSPRNDSTDQSMRGISDELISNFRGLGTKPRSSVYKDLKLLRFSSADGIHELLNTVLFEVRSGLPNLTKEIWCPTCKMFHSYAPETCHRRQRFGKACYEEE